MDHVILKTRVAPEWVDYNGHMNDAEYARVFSLAVDAFWEAIGLTEAKRDATGVTTFTLESHVCFLAECVEAEALTVKIAILDRDAKRCHLFFALYRDDGHLAATSEQMLMAIDQATHRGTVFPDDVALAADGYGQRAREAWPEQVGRKIGIRRR
ncbi:MAG: thioesterase family protein [Salinisphaera sp.]|uniref:thioesterase family protein n=1 Tax=Salinisphaera sp. TaxID=1914330 RepID=UPI003C7C931A